MLDLFNTPVPQNANYQEFYGGGTVRDWVKPRGSSMVRMVLIGAGGGGVGGSLTNTLGAGGASGAITTWIGPAIFVPDVLRVVIGAGGNGGLEDGNGQNGGATSITYQAKETAGYTLLTANGGGGGTGITGGAAAAASSNNYFGAAGIFSSIAGQAGAPRNGAITASTTTFLSGGAGGAATSGVPGSNVNTNYGYPTITGGAGTTGGNGGDGFFITQPLMLGAGGAGGGGHSSGTSGSGGNGGIGCGGGGGGRGTTSGGKGGNGGPGAVFIWSW
jgi:hypothetical protein